MGCFCEIATTCIVRDNVRIDTCHVILRVINVHSKYSVKRHIYDKKSPSEFEISSFTFSIRMFQLGTFYLKYRFEFKIILTLSFKNSNFKSLFESRISDLKYVSWISSFQSQYQAQFRSLRGKLKTTQTTSNFIKRFKVSPRDMREPWTSFVEENQVRQVNDPINTSLTKSLSEMRDARTQKIARDSQSSTRFT